MLTFQDMTLQDRDIVLPMVDEFYHSDAVDHPAPPEVLERSFLAAADPDEPLLRGVLICDGEEAAGYLYVTQCYSAEVGGRCIFIEEIFIQERFRGRGLGGSILTWLEKEYPDARRFRLEVTQVNQGAARLYQRTGYQYLRYDQMVLDKTKEN